MTKFSKHLSSLRFSSLLAGVGLLVGALVPSFTAFAAPVTGFNAGNIMNDVVFTDRSSMSTSDIQTFLNSKNPNCDPNGTKTSEFGGGTRRQWAEARGYSAPFTCLKDYNEDGKSAAQIIYNAAQEFSINPQVLIVLLQKEQGLVTDEWPLPTQYRTATGYGCPDTAPCDSQYYGLTNQLRWAARMFRAIVGASPTWYTPYVLGENYIRYSPTASCGGSTVNIQNRATQALYNYTPYQPNQGALNAGWGTADCGAYGNRNFYLYFTSWFGSTQESYQTSKDTVNFERLVGASPAVKTDANALGTSTTTITAGSVLHTFYFDDTLGVLKHAWHDDSGWHTEIVDGDANRSNGSVQANVGAYVTGYYDNSSGLVRIYYYNASSGSLRQGILTTSTSTWSFNTLDGSGGQSGYGGNVGEGITAMKYGNYTQVMYYDSSLGNLRHAWTNASGWNFENLDGDGGSIAGRNANLGLMPTMTMYNNNIQLYYYDASSGNLRHAWTDVRGWNFENLDGESGSIARYTGDIGLTPSVTVFRGHLQLYYYDATRGNLRHAWTDDAHGWNFENFDGDDSGLFRYNANVGLRTAVKVYQSDLFVFYYDQTNSLWRVAYADNDGWHAADLDGSSRGLSRTATPARGRLSVDVYGNSLQAFYQDSANGLRHAWINR